MGAFSAVLYDTHTLPASEVTQGLLAWSGGPSPRFAYANSARVSAREAGPGVVMTVIGEQPRQAHASPRLDVRALVAFFALAYALSWSWVIPPRGSPSGRAPRRNLADPLPSAIRTSDRGGGGHHVDHRPPRDTRPAGPGDSMAGSTTLVAGGLDPGRVPWARADRDGWGRESPAERGGLRAVQRYSRRSAWQACCCSSSSAPWARRPAGADMPSHSCSAGSARSPVRSSSQCCGSAGICRSSS